MSAERDALRASIGTLTTLHAKHARDEEVATRALAAALDRVREADGALAQALADEVRARDVWNEARRRPHASGDARGWTELAAFVRATASGLATARGVTATAREVCRASEAAAVQARESLAAARARSESVSARIDAARRALAVIDETAREVEADELAAARSRRTAR